MRKKIQILLLAFLTLTAMLQAQYKVSMTFHIPSGGGYDYTTVDSSSDRLYLSHGSQVNVINKMTGDSIGVIKTEKDVHGIALAHEFGKGYISNGSLNSVLVFDLKTLRVLTHVPAGQFTDGIFYDDYAKKVVTCNGRGKSMTIVDPAIDQVTATVQLTGWPETAVSDGKGQIYVNNAEKSEIDVIDSKTYQITHTWPIAPGQRASGLAIDRNTMRLFAGCDNQKLVVMDAVSGQVITTVPIGEECDAVGFDKKLRRVFSSNGDGTLTVIQEVSADQFKVMQNLSTKKGARTQAVDQSTHSIYLPTGEFGAKKPGEFRPALIPGTFQVLVVEPQQ